jgi:hypothetical protein
MMLILMVGCSLFEEPRDLLYDAESRALDLHVRSVEFFEAGEYERSLALLNEAITLDGQSPELWLSQAISLAETGDLVRAVQSATRAVALGELTDPTTGAALYNRGCWRLAMGEEEAGAQDVMAAVATGSIDPLRAVSDPDLQLLADSEEYHDVLPFELPVDLSIDSESYFVGSRWEISFRLESSYGETPTIGSVSTTAPIHLVEIVDNVIDLGAHEAHELTYRFVVDGVMSGEIGPFHIESSGLERFLPSRPFLFLGPEAHESNPGSQDVEFLVPSALFREESERVDFRENGRVSVREVDREVIDWQPVDVVALHVRSAGQPVWSGYDATLMEVSGGEQEIVIALGSQDAVYSR